MIPIYKPYLTEKNTEHVIAAIKSGWISAHGEYLERIKPHLQKLSGCKYSVLTNSGTTACHLMAMGLRYKYPNIKKIIVPNSCFIAAYSQLLVNPIYELVPVKSDKRTWNFDLHDFHLKITENDPKETAILIVHNIGNILNVPELKRKYPDYVFIEDNCEGFLGKYEDKPSGSESLMSCVSYFSNKSVTSGEGGALYTNDGDLFEYLNARRSHGPSSSQYTFDDLGFNYRMTNVQAAILLGQIESLDFIQSEKNRVFDQYKKCIGNDYYFQEEALDTEHSKWMLGLHVGQAETMYRMLSEYGIETRRMFPPITRHKYLNYLQFSDSVADYLRESVLILPSYPELTNNEIGVICKTLKELKSG